ncbi:hypothetical protein BOTNAR_0241g00080 [Botryotinia narcissicola]|uniref:Uncharacterized protein n=1 Tax=Botryotinia narcissicola TaxID=278944 RepID=A0A4Z1I2M5_9HELO|nr:hypothetical protein BOTNAR_0241g00080 [Botryotinia narcissicola]
MGLSSTSQIARGAFFAFSQRENSQYHSQKRGHSFHKLAVPKSSKKIILQTDEEEAGESKFTIVTPQPRSQNLNATKVRGLRPPWECREE